MTEKESMMNFVMEKAPGDMRESTLFSIVPPHCFSPENCDLFETKFEGKPIYISGNHSAALKAWYKESKTGPFTLISFDEHTDLIKPLCVYCNMALRGDEERLVVYLNELKARLTDDAIADLYVPDTGLMGEQIVKITNAQQITTAMYMGFITNAYVCSPSYFEPELHTDHPALRAIYDRVKLVSEVYRDQYQPFPFGKCEYIDDARCLIEKARSNIDDYMLDMIMGIIGKMDKDYVLDIDLDYFRTPCFLQQTHKSFTRFCRLVRDAKAITIATEASWVNDQNIRYTEYYKNVERNCRLLGCTNPFLPSWSSRDLLKHLLGLIEFELSGQRSACDAHDNLWTETLKACSGRPLVRTEEN